MTSKPNPEFELFKKEFTKWQGKLGVTGYRIDFEHVPLVDCYAQVEISERDHVAAARLANNTSKKDMPFRDIRYSAKHEAIHLMLGHFKHLAGQRFVSPDEINGCEEELTVKLTELIHD